MAAFAFPLFECGKKQGSNNGCKNRCRKDIYPKRQSTRRSFAFRKIRRRANGVIAGGITTDRAAPFKKSFLSGKTAGGAEDRSETPAAFGTIFRFPGYLHTAALAKETRRFLIVPGKKRHFAASLSHGTRHSIIGRLLWDRIQYPLWRSLRRGCFRSRRFFPEMVLRYRQSFLLCRPRFLYR